MSEGTDVKKNEGEVLKASMNRWTFTWKERLEDQRHAGEQQTGSIFYCSIG
jgi:hypothetical protein